MITIKMSKIANTFLYNYKYNWHVKSDNLIKGNQVILILKYHISVCAKINI